jgi:hypothetical protein
LTALGCLSCSGGDALQPVRGKVLYRNKPLPGALVTFHPKGANPVTVVRPVGLTGADGTFTLTTGQKAGAPAGEYVVTVICSEAVEPPAGKGFSTAPPETRDRLKGAYADREKSALQVEIKKGANQLEPFPLE